MSVFTPMFSKENNLRAHMELSGEDAAKIRRGRGWKATVTDLRTGRSFLVKAASCGIRECFCAAVIVKEVFPPEQLLKLLPHAAEPQKGGGRNLENHK